MLRAVTGDAWIQAVLADFDNFLLDHAAAERKAAAMATSFVVQYPDKFALHIPMVRLAREELLHYQQVLALIHKRKLIWERDEKDPYIAGLLPHLSTDKRLRLLDRLLLGSVVEARGVERFGLVAENVADEKLQRFYDRLSKSEATHTELFAKLARKYFDETEIEQRLDHWLDLEAAAIQAVPVRAALH
ncbi:MAG: tRNA isopentenyl-2-thiomethyl-A-37 hydroxylase MiaE [Acidobacteriota bacterium]|nr:tRNA isopentenyl-2-thiomethyl-A-37 hydroxylase MiaE [Acidobacteriota bacterium]